MYSSNMDYYRATSLSDAIKVLEKNKGAKLLAGGHMESQLAIDQLASCADDLHVRR